MAGRCRPSTTVFFPAKLLSRVGIRWVARWCMRLAYLPLCAAAALAGCSSGSGGQRVAQAPAPPDWRSIATDSDRHRLREWRTAWVRGLEKARASGHGAALAHEGALLDRKSTRLNSSH